MPLFKTIQYNERTQILVWKITETLDQLNQGIRLSESSNLRLQNMKSLMQQRAFLSVRKLLHEIELTDDDLFYDVFGKPHLSENYISITHSHHFSAIAISNQKVGIDIELQREKIIKIADKFIDKEWNFIPNNENLIKNLTVIWGVKEAVFKIKNLSGISFKDHIFVQDFKFGQLQTKAFLEMETIKENFDVFYEEIENFILVYAFEATL